MGQYIDVHEHFQHFTLARNVQRWRVSNLKAEKFSFALAGALRYKFTLWEL